MAKTEDGIHYICNYIPQRLIDRYPSNIYINKLLWSLKNSDDAAITFMAHHLAHHLCKINPFINASNIILLSAPTSKANFSPPIAKCIDYIYNSSEFFSNNYSSINCDKAPAPGIYNATITKLEYIGQSSPYLNISISIDEKYPDFNMKLYFDVGDYESVKNEFYLFKKSRLFYSSQITTKQWHFFNSIKNCNNNSEINIYNHLDRLVGKKVQVIINSFRSAKGKYFERPEIIDFTYRDETLYKDSHLTLHEKLTNYRPDSNFGFRRVSNINATHLSLHLRLSNYDTHIKTIKFNGNLPNIKAAYIVIDDIVTSGATLNACRDILISKGVPRNNIIRLAIAKTIKIK